MAFLQPRKQFRRAIIASVYFFNIRFMRGSTDGLYKVVSHPVFNLRNGSSGIPRYITAYSLLLWDLPSVTGCVKQFPESYSRHFSTSGREVAPRAPIRANYLRKQTALLPGYVRPLINSRFTASNGYWFSKPQPCHIPCSIIVSKYFIPTSIA